MFQDSKIEYEAYLCQSFIKVRDSTVLVTGGLARDEGLCSALQEQALDQKLAVQIRTHTDSIFAGAIGAAIWGEIRYRKLNQA